MDNFNQLYTDLLDKLASWLNQAILILPNFVVAIIVVLGFVFLANLTRKGVRKLMSKASDNQAINNLIAQIVKVAVICVGVFFALGILELDKTVTSVLAGLGVVGLALGFAFQNTATNFISGVLMASKFPLRVGDQVESNGHFGVVEEIGMRYTIIKTFQGQTVVVPNKSILESPLKNYTFTEERRVDIDCGVGYGDDLERAEKAAISAIEGLRLSDTPIEVMYSGFGDSSINFTLRFWLRGKEHKEFLTARSAAIKAIKKSFDEEGINIPFPIRTIDIKTDQIGQLMERFFSDTSQKVSQNGALQQQKS